MSSDPVTLIREVFSYAQQFRGATFVIHVDHGAVSDDRIENLIHDLVILLRAGIRIVLVPGARNRIDEVLDRYGIAWRRERGVRIATAETIPFIKMAAFDVTNRYLTLLSAEHTNAVIGNWVRARGIGVVDGIDFEQAGTVERIQLDLLRSTLDQGAVPIFPCIGWSAAGKPYNISSRELALRIALSLGAEKLFFVSDRMGIRDGEVRLPDHIDVAADGRISRLTVADAEALLRLNGVDPDDGGAVEPSGYHEGARDALELIRIALRAARGDVERVHIVDGGRDGVILVELFSRVGIGTMVHANIYESIRPMRPDEIGSALGLMQPLVKQGVLLQRTHDEILDRLAEYVVHETDGRVQGCGALHRYENGIAEIAAVAVDAAWEELGIGRRIVRYLMDVARAEEIGSVIALTTRTGDWFESIGFRRVPITELPAERRRRYSDARASIVLRYDFAATNGPRLAD